MSAQVTGYHRRRRFAWQGQAWFVDPRDTSWLDRSCAGAMILLKPIVHDSVTWCNVVILALSCCCVVVERRRCFESIAGGVVASKTGGVSIIVAHVVPHGSP